MVIEKEGLIRAMKVAYKGQGYSVAMEDKAGFEELLMEGQSWAVVVTKEICPGEVLGKVAEHLRGIPAPGEAFRVKKGESQVEIFDAVRAFLKGLHADNAPVQLIRRTGLTLDGARLWQRKEDGRLFMLDEELEAVVDVGIRSIYTVGDSALMFDGKDSRVYLVAETPTASQQEALNHLQSRQWVP